MPRKAQFATLPALARTHTKACVSTLAGIVSQKNAPTASRVAAAAILLDRGWGKAPQPVALDGEASIKVVIRHILAGADGEAIDAAEPVTIEHDPSGDRYKRAGDEEVVAAQGLPNTEANDGKRMGSVCNDTDDER